MEQKVQTVPIALINQQSQPKTKKIPIFFNSNFTLDDRQTQKLYETNNVLKIINNVRPKESNKSDTEFSKMVA
jgi:hypothetical protein